LITYLKSVSVSSNQQITYSDLETQLASYFRSLNQPIAYNDLITSMRNIFRTSNQPISVLEAFFGNRAVAININQNITIYDTIIKNNAFVRTITDILDITEGGYVKAWIGEVHIFGSGDVPGSVIYPGGGGYNSAPLGVVVTNNGTVVTKCDLHSLGGGIYCFLSVGDYVGKFIMPENPVLGFVLFFLPAIAIFVIIIVIILKKRKKKKKEAKND
jgi:hypothetical protein